MCVLLHVHMYVCIYIYTHIDRQRYNSHYHSTESSRYGYYSTIRVWDLNIDSYMEGPAIQEAESSLTASSHALGLEWSSM